MNPGASKTVLKAKAEDIYHPRLAYPLQPRPAPGRPSADRLKGGQNWAPIRGQHSMPIDMLDDVLDSIFKVNSAASGGGGGFFSSLLGGIGSLFGGGFPSLPKIGPVPTPRPYAKGGAFTNSIVDKPTLFSHATGPGVMGEAGAEAIVPLTRDASGRLGVSAIGGGGRGGQQDVRVSTDVSVSVDENGNLKAFVTKTSREQTATMLSRAFNDDANARNFVTRGYKEAARRGMI